MRNPFVLEEALAHMSSLGASDLHVGAGSVPTIRVDGQLQSLPGEFGILTPNDMQVMVHAMLTAEQRETLERDLELDLAHSVPQLGRFRVNLYWQRGSLGAAFRLIDSNIRSLEELQLPDNVRDFAYLPRGMVLVTGPTGSGKSTTLAALIDLVNRDRASHIMTVEDPIEFLHTNNRSIVNQREVGSDTHTFANALKHVLRQDPDVILVGELRDLESISVALTAAETGHLVFATLHTIDAAQTIDRIVDVFPPHQQEQIRTQLAGNLQGVVSQTLLRKRGGGRVVATEILRMTPAVSNQVREGKTHQIYSMLQAGAEQGMHTMDQSLAQLVKEEVIDYDEAREKAGDLASFESLVKRPIGESSPGADAMSSAGLKFDDPFAEATVGGRGQF